ncbi:hypothetical protein MPRF_47290 [Mycolicibacterium parafortuitum]|uniref:Uncharacterized protein n=1 Tax=Mycolicibacterium parafortuitum TaxID=39692 RepID=A0A7I7U9H3_MYCPF|nr:hypothetical protein [Mycolicibacterium parafortuitum]PQE02863.1 hypothetical protein CYL16_04315 [Mycobacterium sp. EPG1]BBY77830.1 hypothetical protein MPRF_47290 [Mycolicibacterium parafortuitum]
MAQVNGDDTTGLAVGCRVRTVGDDPATGEIVEDFGDLAGTPVVVDAQNTVRSRRWAVALDDGQLVFLDDDQLEPLS